MKNYTKVTIFVKKFIRIDVNYKANLLLYGISQPCKYSLLNLTFILMGEGGKIVDISVIMRCPNCHNKMSAKRHGNGAVSGTCPVCKSVIYSKQHTPKEKLIRIVQT